MCVYVFETLCEVTHYIAFKTSVCRDKSWHDSQDRTRGTTLKACAKTRENSISAREENKVISFH